MDWKSRILSAFKKPAPSSAKQVPQKTAFFRFPIINTVFDGQKNEGSLGLAKEYVLDYTTLRARSWQLYVESDIAQNIINKFGLWVVGKGLRLQSEPNKQVLSSLGLPAPNDNFSRKTESMFNMWCNSSESTYDFQGNIHKLAREAEKYRKVGGDALAVVRFREIDGSTTPCLQLIGGENIVNPLMASVINKAKSNGNVIEKGIERNKSGKHIAYYVKTTNGVKRIAAYKGKIKVAWMIYGLKRKNSDVRGMPLLTACMETIKTLDRYKEATVKRAEFQANTVVGVKHDKDAKGENPYTPGDPLVYNHTMDRETVNNEITSNTSETVVSTTAGDAVNLPPGADFTQLSQEGDMYFKDFYEKHSSIASATVGMAPEIANMKSDSSYSAARFALNNHLLTIEDHRKDLADQFYKPFYYACLHLWVMDDTLRLDGYITNYNNIYAKLAYLNCTFEGDQIRNIDPVKEVNAELLKLKGVNGVSLTTYERATKNVGGENFEKNMNTMREELNQTEDIREIVNPEEPESDPNNDE